MLTRTIANAFVEGRDDRSKSFSRSSHVRKRFGVDDRFQSVDQLVAAAASLRGLFAFCDGRTLDTATFDVASVHSLAR